MAYEIGWDTSTNKDYFKDLLKDTFDTTAREALVEYPTMFREVKSTDEYERWARHAGLPDSEDLADGGAINTYDPTFDTTKDVTQKRNGLGFKVTSGMKKFNKWYEVSELTKNLSMKMRESKDKDAANLWNNLTTATTYSPGMFDGLAIASNSHTCLDSASTTYDNYGDAALGVGALEDALIYFDTIVDDMADISPKKPNLLAVQSTERFDAIELLGSEKQPYTADNQINSLTKDFNLEYFVYHRATATTWWVVLDTNDPKYGPIMVTTQEPDIKVQDDVAGLTRSIAVTSEQWYKYDCLDARAVYVGNT
jgi:hypothetical protein